MNIHKMLSRTEKLITDNSPLIMTMVGVLGTVSTAYLAGKSTYAAAIILEDEKQARIISSESKDETPFPFREKAKLVWKLYIPTLATGAVTVTAIVCANRIGTRRAAAIATAYSISEHAFTEYRHKVVEKIGEGQEQKVRDEIAQDQVNRTPMTKMIVTDQPAMLCLDAFSGRYFRCDMETIRSAVNDINAQIIHADYATLSEFYDKLGLEDTSVSGEMGWNTDKMLEVNYSSALRDEKEPCMVVTFATVPVRNPHQLRF